MIDHTAIRVSELGRPQAFQRAALAPRGDPRPMELGAEVAGFGVPPRAHLWLAAGEPNRPPLHLALRTGACAPGDAFDAAALASGGRGNGAPGPGPGYPAGYCGAFALEPDGHNIEGVS